MAVVLGKIQPLKLIRETLDKKGISRFKSISDINLFLKNFEIEKKEIPEKERNGLNQEINDLEESIKIYELKKQQNLIYKFYYVFKIRANRSKIKSVERNFEHILSIRSIESLDRVSFLKKTIDELYPLISGAIGENTVVNELKKLPDSYYLINDFRAEFSTPIYNQSEDDQIYSIQIDHLLISRSGIFVIETKNWNSDSIQRLDFRSPVGQVKRTGFAIFVSLNNHVDLEFKNHHWGDKKIPVRNIIVMTNSMPKEMFKNVKVLPVKNLNSYVEYFDPIFSETEVERLFNYLNNWYLINR